MTGTAATDPLLGVGLPVDDPAESARAAAGLAAAADRCGRLARGAAGLLPVGQWSGVAADAADRRLLDLAVSLSRERARLLRAADAVTAFSRAVAGVVALADEAAALLARARQVQAGADRRDPGLAVGRAASWGGVRADGALFDPEAAALLDRARRSALEARATYDRAAGRLADELAALSGRRVVRAEMSPRVLLDVAGFVPVVGDAVDAVNALVYLRQRRWGDALVTGIASVPGPAGWAAAAARIGKAVGRAGDLERVVEQATAQDRVVAHLSRLTVRGRRESVRLLPDDQAVERFYREVLAPLGTTTVHQDRRGYPFWRTQLEGGGHIVFRPWSASEGFAIDIRDIGTSTVRRIHRPGS